MFKIGRVGWIILYFVAGIIDIIQIFLVFTVAGAGFNLISTPYIGLALFLILQLGGVSMIRRPLRLLSIFGIPIFEGFTFGIAPFWIMDIWFIHRSVRKEKYRNEEAALFRGLLQNVVNIPLISNGIRLPRRLRKVQSQEAKNINGIRPPRGGLK